MARKSHNKSFLPEIKFFKTVNDIIIGSPRRHGSSLGHNFQETKQIISLSCNLSQQFEKINITHLK